MDYLKNVLTNSLGMECGNCIAVYAGLETSSDLIKNTKICVLKMNEGLKSLKRHDGEKWMIEWVNYPLFFSLM